MGKDEAFLKAVEDAPADVTHRLVYADWLEEQGDSRGEMIRLETEMALQAPYSDEYVRLKTRRNELRPQIDPTWLTKLGYVPRHRPLFRLFPPRRVERWRLVEEFIEVWFRPTREGDGFAEAELVATESRLGFRLPAALREWYSLSGKRGEVWSGQDDFLELKDLEMNREDDALFFRRECQSCDWWGIRAADLKSDDPPVFRFDAFRGSRLRDAPRLISPTITGFAAAVLLLHLHCYPGFVSGLCRDPDVWQEINGNLSKCDLPERCCRAGTSPVYFYEGTDIIVGKSTGEELVVVARTEEALGHLSQTLSQRLDRWR
jgi:uncharacterized protein (TIGR02996 family)